MCKLLLLSSKVFCHISGGTPILKKKQKTKKTDNTTTWPLIKRCDYSNFNQSINLRHFPIFQFTINLSVSCHIFTTTVIVRKWISCETIKRLHNWSNSNLKGKQVVCISIPCIAILFSLCYGLSCHVILTLSIIINANASSKQSHGEARNQPYLPHVTFVDGLCCFQESLSCLRLIPACPKDAQLVLIAQTTNT